MKNRTNRKSPPGTEEIGCGGFFIGKNMVFEFYRRFRAPSASMEYSLYLRRPNETAFFGIRLDPEDEILYWYMGKSMSKPHRHGGRWVRMMAKSLTWVTAENMKRRLLTENKQTKISRKLGLSVKPPVC